MTAGLFHLHGVWVGRCREPDNYNEKGFFENLDFKKALIERHGRMAQSLEPDKEAPEDWDKVVKKFGPDDGPWLVKHSSRYWKVWDYHAPKIICVRRCTRSTIASGIATKMYGSTDRKTVNKLVELHHESMDKAIRKHGGVNVMVDRLIKGDLRSIQRALNYCKLEMDEKAVKKFISPGLFHY